MTGKGLTLRLCALVLAIGSWNSSPAAETDTPRRQFQNPFYDVTFDEEGYLALSSEGNTLLSRMRFLLSENISGTQDIEPRLTEFEVNREEAGQWRIDASWSTGPDLGVTLKSTYTFRDDGPRFQVGFWVENDDERAKSVFLKVAYDLGTSYNKVIDSTDGERAAQRTTLTYPDLWTPIICRKVQKAGDAESPTAGAYLPYLGVFDSVTKAGFVLLGYPQQMWHLRATAFAKGETASGAVCEAFWLPGQKGAVDDGTFFDPYAGKPYHFAIGVLRHGTEGEILQSLYDEWPDIFRRPVRRPEGLLVWGPSPLGGEKLFTEAELARLRSWGVRYYRSGERNYQDIDLYHKYGIKYFFNVNPMEAAFNRYDDASPLVPCGPRGRIEGFDSCILRDENGVEQGEPYWYNAHQSTAWGKTYLGFVEEVIGLYPKIDGIYVEMASDGSGGVKLDYSNTLGHGYPFMPLHVASYDAISRVDEICRAHGLLLIMSTVSTPVQAIPPDFATQHYGPMRAQLGAGPTPFYLSVNQMGTATYWESLVMVNHDFLYGLMPFMDWVMFRKCEEGAPAFKGLDRLYKLSWQVCAELAARKPNIILDPEAVSVKAAKAVKVATFPGEDGFYVSLFNSTRHPTRVKLHYNTAMLGIEAQATYVVGSYTATGGAEFRSFEGSQLVPGRALEAVSEFALGDIDRARVVMVHKPSGDAVENLGFAALVPANGLAVSWTTARIEEGAYSEDEALRSLTLRLDGTEGISDEIRLYLSDLGRPTKVEGGSVAAYEKDPAYCRIETAPYTRGAQLRVLWERGAAGLEAPLLETMDPFAVEREFFRDSFEGPELDPAKWIDRSDQIDIEIKDKTLKIYHRDREVHVSTGPVLSGRSWEARFMARFPTPPGDEWARVDLFNVGSMDYLDVHKQGKILYVCATRDSKAVVYDSVGPLDDEFHLFRFIKDGLRLRLYVDNKLIWQRELQDDFGRVWGVRLTCRSMPLYVKWLRLSRRSE